MYKTLNFDDLISQYYDNEFNASERLRFEARLAISKDFKNYVEDKCYEYFTISN